MINLLKNLINEVLPLRLFGFLVIRHKLSQYHQPKSFFLHPRKEIKTYKRDDFLLNFVNGKRVLHFGFLDYPITQSKISDGNLLHTKLQKYASYVYGIDVNLDSLNLYREFTGDHENTCINFLDNNSDVSSLNNKYEVILFPEVLEHLKNPGTALEKLKEISLINSECKIVITVPNAYSLTHFQYAFEGVEHVHPDHYCYYSPVTLEKLLIDCGFKNIEIYQYSWSENKEKIGLTQSGVIAVCNA